MHVIVKHCNRESNIDFSGGNGTPYITERERR